MEDKNFNPAESLNLIESMIKQAKSAEKNNGLGWILWGWLLFTATVSHYIAIQMKWEYRQYIWPVFGIAAILLMFYSFAGNRIFNKQAKVKTYTGQLLSKVSLAFFVSLFVMVYGNARTGVEHDGINFGYLQILYAFWMFIFAAAFRFNLFYWGAAFNWIGAMVIFYFKEKLGAEILLVHAACVTLGYLIPGHIAYSRFYKNDEQK